MKLCSKLPINLFFFLLNWACNVPGLIALLSHKCSFFARLIEWGSTDLAVLLPVCMVLSGDGCSCSWSLE